MKKLLLSFAAVLFCSSSFSQPWIDVGIKGAFNSTWLLNGNYNKDKNVQYGFAMAPAGGVKLGFNFSETAEITVDLMYTSVSQKYYSSGLPFKWNRQLTLQYLEVPLLFRSNKDGTYLEIGPQYSMLWGVRDVVTTDPSSSLGYSISNKDHYNRTNIGAVFGFGSFLLGTENAYLCLGMRFAYGFLDIVSDEGGKGREYISLNPAEPEISSYKPTNTLYGGFVLELNYDLGYLTSTKCGKRKVIFFD
jgi:hypothetical protein